jgi:hypothetical protein
MYGLPQAGRLANDLIIKLLALHGYHPVGHAHGLWRHETRTVTFTLVADDFEVKYVDREHTNHLLNTLTKYYEVTKDWEGNLYCGISLDWYYKNKTIDLSMPGYIDNALHKFQYKPPDRPQHAPYPARKPQYGSKVQLTPDIVDSPTLTPAGKNRIQQVFGALLHYARVVDPTIMTDISSLASQQVIANEDMITKLL